MTRFYIDTPLTAGSRTELPRELTHHALRVLRMRDGDALTLFNGRGGEYHGRLIAAGPKAHVAAVDLLDFDAREAELPFAVTLAQGLSGGDKMEWTIEKAVELGAAAIQPLACARSVVRLTAERAGKRQLHWQALIEAACGQCGRNRVPPVHSPAALRDWLSRVPVEALKLMLSPRGERPLTAIAAPRTDQSVYLLVGPEGGFAPDEEAAAQAAGFLPVTIGPRILRTETAAAAALAMLAALWSARAEGN